MTNKLDFLWYKLFSTEGFGPKSISIVYNTIHNLGIPLEEIFVMSESEFEKTFPELGKGRLRKATFEAIQKLNEEKIYQEYQELRNNGIKIIYPGCQLYPVKLLELTRYGVPPILFCKGQLSLLNSEGVAIVGSRNASEEGIKIAKKFASELVMLGKNVISGYAKGIDTSAHLGALEKDGTTTIVLSYGIMEFSKKKIFKNVRWEGNTLIVSQFRLREKWSARNAMIRNKLVCALSEAVIVIESGGKENGSRKMSGTFNAGYTALKTKVPLFVVNPDSFRNIPIGNKKLIELGGIEIQPDDGISEILKHLEKKRKGIESVMNERQMSLFEQNQNGGKY